jgi:hypothetical protein
MIIKGLTRLQAASLLVDGANYSQASLKTARAVSTGALVNPKRAWFYDLGNGKWKRYYDLTQKD